MPKFHKNWGIEPGDLEWKERLGAGGCGEVFKVLHKTSGPLAIKLLSTTFVDDG